MLELRDITKSYGEIVAAAGVSFRLHPGEMLGFVGSNGAGKTTCMRIVLGLLEPDRGEVEWNGRPVDSNTRRRFGYMPEERGLYPKMRVANQVAYFGRLHGLGKEEASAAAGRLLERLGVEERADDRVEALSLGNQQRVQLATAMVHDPDAMILDEPFSGLDPVGVDVLTEVLRDRVEAGVPVVFSSHQLELVERICDSVVILHNGRVVAEGPVHEVRAERSDRTLRVEVDGALPGWEASIPGVQVVSRSNGSVLLRLGDGVDDQSVLAVARGAGRVTYFSSARPSLVDLFRSVVGSDRGTE
ncbi:MAG TPA: ATP-binding cassette domain-containing protein [Acidimicrobiia bacterium]|jgi:ABC-2 type transport system ATP-binding protein|nr:ATP-binding cassette domain-containing protein [Acidimicrobiia bacterium]